jgi:hypothetical protein
VAAGGVGALLETAGTASASGLVGGPPITFTNNTPLSTVIVTNVGGGYGGTFQGGKAPLRLVPAGTVGAPTLGVHAQGELFVDVQGTSFMCMASGGPGRWASLSNYIYDVRAYGAKGDGVTDDTAAIQAAIGAAAAGNGGIVFFPAGVYMCASTLRLDGTQSMRLEGTPTTELQYTGTADTFISATGTFRFTLRWLRITYTSSTFTGVLVRLDGSSTSDSGDALIENCVLGGVSGAKNAAALVSLDGTISSTIRNCDMEYADVAIRGIGTVRGYSNAIQVQDNAFPSGALGTAAIINAGQAWLIQGNTFENLQSGAAGAFISANAPGDSVSFIGNWFGDANDQGTWITWSGANLLVAGNYFSGGATGIAFSPGSPGISIISNQFGGLTAIDVKPSTGLTQGNVVILGNQYYQDTTPLNGTLPTGAIYQTGAGTIALGPGSSTGAPTIGAHQIGELSIDATGILWICTASGTPGGWQTVGSQA